MRNRYLELQLGPVTLRPDGVIVVGGHEFHQSSGIEIDNDGRGGLIKESGEGEPLTVTDSTGESVTVAYRDNSWWSDADLSAYTASSTERERQAPHSAPQSRLTGLGGFRRLLPWVAAVGLAAVAVVSAVYLLEPLRRLDPFPSGKPPAAEAPKPPPKTSASLLSELGLLHTSTTNKFHGLERDMNGMASRFQTAVGRSIEQTNARPDAWPRQVNFALKERPEFDPAFTRLRNNPLPFDELAAQKKSLDQVTDRIRTETASGEDKNILHDIAEWSKEQSRALEQSKKDLETIETVLERYRDDPRLRTAERSTP